MARVDMVKEHMLTSMKAANFSMIIYGIESFSLNTIRDMNKSARQDYLEKARQNVIATMQAGITPFSHIISFWPSADCDSIVETITESCRLMQRGARIGINKFYRLLAIGHCQGPAVG